jgi:hypothetical protein
MNLPVEATHKALLLRLMLARLDTITLGMVQGSAVDNPALMMQFLDAA